MKSCPLNLIRPLRITLSASNITPPNFCNACTPWLAAEHWRVIGITAVDLYIPILKYVFGEAQMGGPCAIVSFHRLRQEFYGLDRDDVLFGQRLLKESAHELGHTFHLRHCQDYRCAMASAHAVEWIDLREGSFCHSCRSQLESSILPARSDLL